MKKIILVLNALFLSVVSLAQTNPCEIDLAYQDSLFNLWPDTIENLPIAQVDTYYETHVQIKTPNEVGEVTGYPYLVDLGLGFESDVAGFIIDSIKMVDVSGLPDGMSLYFSAPNATYLGNDVGCVTLYGNTTAEMIGTHDIVFIVDGWVSFGDLVISLYESVGDYEEITGYKLIVSEDGTASIVSNDNNTFELNQNFPNPFDESTEISFQCVTSEEIIFSVVDIFGKTVMERNLDAIRGINKINLNSNELSTGLYFYSISNGLNTQTKRMLVVKK
jgi:hypothetical protein